MKFKNTDSGLPPLLPSQSHFCVRYIAGRDVRYKTVVAAEDIKGARKWFEDHYPTADVHSVRPGIY